MSISGIYALSNQVTDTIIKSGIVDIETEVYKLDAQNNEVAYGEDSTRVVPGEKLSFIPKVLNLGMDCYVRVQINYIDENTDFMDYVTGFSEDLVKHGDYYYYKKPLKSKEVINIFDTITIPEDVYSRTTTGRIKLEIIAQAIQDKNFQPDYSLEDPWKNIKPMKTTNDSYDISDGTRKITVRYENNTDKNIELPDKFLEDLYNLMPGDSFNSVIGIKAQRNTKYLLKIDTSENDLKELLLLSNIKLKIVRTNGNVIYDGNLKDAGSIVLGKYNLDEKDNIRFIVEAPAELDNEFENLNPKITLIFSAETDENKDQKEDEEKKSPQTGDKINVTIIIFILSSICLAIVIILDHILQKKNNII